MNYVCPHCFNRVNKCTCELWPPYNLIWVDTHIQEHVRILNNKGYKTRFSCEGHNGYIHIIFSSEYGFNEMELPNGYVYNPKKLELKYVLNNELLKEEREKQKFEALDNLLEWCKNLIERNE